MTRFALIYTATDDRVVAQYLPSNYTVLGDVIEGVVIVGKDVNGWTLEDYVLPRLASGLYFGRELSPDDVPPLVAAAVRRGELRDGSRIEDGDIPMTDEWSDDA